ncbi:MAG: Maf family protein [Clostridiales bacterium]|nr:Maf family protein [Clostridiales bacterium]
MLFLASQSPRRKELLDLAGLKYICEPANVDELVPDELAVEKIPEYLAKKKAAKVLSDHPHDVVLGADTIVVWNGEVLGKPQSDYEAFEMLRKLSGSVHHVYTGVAILSEENPIAFTTVTEVEFYQLTDREIRDYIATGEPMDKAGAYGIQGKGALLVKRIQGDYYTVVGLPIGEVVRHLPTDIKGGA